MAKQFDPEIGKKTRWRKGQPSPNPGGRPRKTLLTLAYLDILSDPYPGDKNGRSIAEVIAWRIAMDAAKGKLDAAREIADRTEGKSRGESSLQASECAHQAPQGSSAEDAARRLMELTERLRSRIQARSQSNSHLVPANTSSSAPCSEGERESRSQ